MGFTAVKDKAFERYKILAERVAPDTVNTKPMATLRAVADHVVIRSDAVRTRYDEAWGCDRRVGSSRRRCGGRLGCFRAARHRLLRDAGMS